MAFRGEQSGGGEDGLDDLTKAIIEDVLRMPGNEVCCDCGASGVYCCRACVSTEAPRVHILLLLCAESTLSLVNARVSVFLFTLLWTNV